MKVLIIDDTPREWDAILELVIAEICDIDRDISCNTPFGGERDPHAAIDFEVMPPDVFRTDFRATASGYDCMIFDVSLEGDTDSLGCDLAQEFMTATLYPIHRIWFVTNKSVGNVELSTKLAAVAAAVQSRVSPVALSKNNGRGNAARIYSFIPAPQPRSGMWNPALAALLLNTDLDRFLHQLRIRDSPTTAIDQFTVQRGRLSELAILRDSKFGVAAWEVDNPGGGQTTEPYLAGYADGDKLADFLADSQRIDGAWHSGAMALLDPTALKENRCDLPKVRLNDILFPRVRSEGGMFWYLLRRTFTLARYNSPIILAREEFPFTNEGVSFRVEDTKAFCPLSWFHHLGATRFFEDTKRDVGDIAFRAKVACDRGRSATLLLWHEGPGYPNEDALANSCARMFDGCLPFCHMFVASKCGTGDVVTVEVLPNEPCRRVGRPSLALGDGRLNFETLGKGTVYAFVFPTVAQLR